MRPSRPLARRVGERAKFVAVTLAIGLAVAALLFAIHQRGSAHDYEQLVPMRVLQSDAAGELPLAYTQMPYKV